MRLGNAFMSHATLSRIIPGTSQSIDASSTWLSCASATFIVTPSIGWPGSKRYASGKVAPSSSTCRGKSSSVTDSAPWRIRSAFVSCSSFGSFAEARSCHASKERTSRTSGGMRAS
jgi:hypothetical protein